MVNDKIILFPSDRIKRSDKVLQDTTENKRKVAKVQLEKTKEFVETHVDDMAMMFLRRFVEIAVKTDKPEFTKGLSILIDILRGILYKDFNVNHPAQKMIDKMVKIKETRSGPQAEINYDIFLNDNDSKVTIKPLSKDIREEIKFHNEGWEDFNDDFDPKD
jgi:hypothetical protein